VFVALGSNLSMPYTRLYARLVLLFVSLVAAFGCTSLSHTCLIFLFASLIAVLRCYLLRL